LRGDASTLDTQLRSRPVQAARSWPRARLAAWGTALGIVLSSATIISSAINVISIQQAIGMALASTLTTLGSLIAWIVPDAWIAWRRGFRRGCEAAAAISHTCRLSADLTAKRAMGRPASQAQELPRGPGLLYLPTQARLTPRHRNRLRPVPVTARRQRQ
jgi:hypothetical protein